MKSLTSCNLLALLLLPCAAQAWSAYYDGALKGTGTAAVESCVPTASFPPNASPHPYCQCGDVSAELVTTKLYPSDALRGQAALATAVGYYCQDAGVTMNVLTTVTVVPTTKPECFPIPSVDSKAISQLRYYDIQQICGNHNTTWAVTKSLNSTLDVKSENDWSLQIPGYHPVIGGFKPKANAPNICPHMKEMTTSLAPDDFCMKALQELGTECPGNGGSIDNICGTTWILPLTGSQL